MWVFYLISLPLTLGMVLITLRYFAGPDVPRYVLFTVGYAWFCSLSIIILVPADIWTTIIGHDKGGIAFFWMWSYWSTFLLTWAVVPTIQGYEDAGDFTLTERLRTSIHANLVFYLIVGSIGLLGLILLIIMHRIRKYVASFRTSRSGTLGSFLDMTEFLWRCILKKQLEKFSAVLLGCMSVAILLAEATLLPSGVDLSLFSILINAVGKQEMLVQIAAFAPLMYMCICTYYSLFKVGRLMFYSLTPRQTSSVSLLMICSMVARYAPPISYNFLNLIRLGGDAKTIFEKRMGNIDDAVPFFGKRFNKIYPLIMVIYTVLVASNFFGRMIDFFGSWKWFSFQNEEEEDMNGFDPSGVIILQKERSWLEQGCKVGEQVIPLARNFNSMNVDLESGNVTQGKASMDEATGTPSKSNKEESQRYNSSRETLANKYAAIRKQHVHSASTAPSKEKAISTISVSLLDSSPPQNLSVGNSGVSSSGLSSTWASMKNGFQNFKANVGAKKFLPLRQLQETTSFHTHVSSSESLDDIFQRLKQKPSRDHNGNYGYNDSDDGEDI